MKLHPFAFASLTCALIGCAAPRPTLPWGAASVPPSRAARALEPSYLVRRPVEIYLEAERRRLASGASSVSAAPAVIGNAVAITAFRAYQPRGYRGTSPAGTVSSVAGMWSSIARNAFLAASR